ncbi:hypothetical protein PR202_gb29491 [Eleusine coracana subsp. coracana]|uniref:Uncharacterized protein n=1 Tax=Eleusine coracana subsp. coracana TaxID=191504 RepID=A0AAV5FZF5_ELECO|nr:hypothetical protein PR202_gb29491 [Eleusine coracana subsp. coracana]
MLWPHHFQLFGKRLRAGVTGRIDFGASVVLAALFRWTSDDTALTASPRPIALRPVASALGGSSAIISVISPIGAFSPVEIWTGGRAPHRYFGNVLADKLYRRYELPNSTLQVHRLYPAEFLLVCQDVEVATRFYDEGNIMQLSTVTLHFRQWSRFHKAECYHYLLDASIKLYQLGIDWTTPEHGPINSVKRLCSIMSPGTANGCHAAETLKCTVLDIEGTTTPISFVTDVMFPYARDNVRKHLTSTLDSEETKEDIKLLRAQIDDDLRNGISGAVPVPPSEASKEEVINALVANVESMIKADRKITSLKQLQGHIWRTGFEKKELQGIVFDDVPEALKNWHDSGIKIYIYSSGSREAQRLLFGNTTYGDLRKFLCGYFDTTTG